MTCTSRDFVHWKWSFGISGDSFIANTWTPMSHTHKEGRSEGLERLFPCLWSRSTSGIISPGILSLDASLFFPKVQDHLGGSRFSHQNDTLHGRSMQKYFLFMDSQLLHLLLIERKLCFRPFYPYLSIYGKSQTIDQAESHKTHFLDNTSGLPQLLCAELTTTLHQEHSLPQ